MLNLSRSSAIYAVVFMLSSPLVNPVYARAIDCDKIKAPTEHAICKNPDLYDADQRLNKAYQKAMSAVGKSSKQGQQLLQSQKSWLKKRNFAWEQPKGACYQEVSCLVLMYEERINSLEN